MEKSIGRLEVLSTGDIGIEGAGLLAVLQPVAGIQQSTSEQNGYARRIVACVNALDDFKLDAIEKHTVWPAAGFPDTRLS